ncbi:MAG: hypothetical protein RPR97_17490 [Colwellia sp.]
MKLCCITKVANILHFLSMSYVNHHHEKSNDDSVESDNVSKTFDALLKAVIMFVKVPSPNGTHNNGH